MCDKNMLYNFNIFNGLPALNTKIKPCLCAKIPVKKSNFTKIC